MRRSPTKHRAILNAGASIVAAQGYHATSIEAVAAKAGSGKQTIYRWWPSKADLFVEVYDDLVKRTALADAFRGNDTSLLTALAALLDRLFTFYHDTPAGDILAGLIGEAAENATVLDALKTGLVVGRAPIVTDLVDELAKKDIHMAAIAAHIVNETVVALVWKRLVMTETLDASAAREIAAIAVAAGHYGGGR